MRVDFWPETKRILIIEDAERGQILQCEGYNTLTGIDK